MPIIKLQTLMKKDTPQVRDFIIQQLKHYGYRIHTGQWYVFAQGTAPVCLVAHMDTVHAKPHKQWVIEDIQKPLKAAHIMREVLEAASCEVNILRRSN